MAVDVTLILKELLAANRGPNPTDPAMRQSPDYGVAALLDGSILDVMLTFKKGRALLLHGMGLPSRAVRWPTMGQTARGASQIRRRCTPKPATTIVV